MARRPGHISRKPLALNSAESLQLDCGCGAEQTDSITDQALGSGGFPPRGWGVVVWESPWGSGRRGLRQGPEGKGQRPHLSPAPQGHGFCCQEGALPDSGQTGLPELLWQVLGPPRQ